MAETAGPGRPNRTDECTGGGDAQTVGRGDERLDLFVRQLDAVQPTPRSAHGLGSASGTAREGMRGAAGLKRAKKVRACARTGFQARKDDALT